MCTLYALFPSQHANEAHMYKLLKSYDTSTPPPPPPPPPPKTTALPIMNSVVHYHTPALMAPPQMSATLTSSSGVSGSLEGAVEESLTVAHTHTHTHTDTHTNMHTCKPKHFVMYKIHVHVHVDVKTKCFVTIYLFQRK